MKQSNELGALASPVADVKPAASTLPLISVIMANHNGGRFLAHAIGSVLAQRGIDLELLLIDDASSDDGVSIMREYAHRDTRVRVFVSPVNLGPAAARNIGIDHADGAWIAVVDSDDLLHPDRMARLVAAAIADGADIAADDLLQFDQEGRASPRAVLGSSMSRWIDPASYIRSNALFGHGAAYGYLKPVFRARGSFAKNIRYNPALRISEDYDLVLRMMLAGARLKTYPYLTYFYRKHDGSISHRLPEAALRAMLVADDSSLAGCAVPSASVSNAMRSRRASIVRALAFTAIVHALKARMRFRAMALMLDNPRAAGLLVLPLRSAVSRRMKRARPPRALGSDICLISRQRVVGNTNGSSAYLLDLCRTLVAQGWRVHFVCPSPAIFGRWPVLWLQPEMDVFASLRIRGGLRMGRLVVALDPRIVLQAGVTMMRRFAVRLGLRVAAPEKRAAYAVAVPWRAKDQLYLARYARECGDIVLADYAFLTEGLAYVLRPDAPTAVIMHDLFSARAEQFARAGAADSVACLSAEAEYALLGQADMVIAIQDDEAAKVREHLPAKAVLVAPMSVSVVAGAQPGEATRLLFVGGNTAPNVIGLNWFLTQVWPQLLRALPYVSLDVAGSVGALVGEAPGVRRLGRVADLAPIYRDAGVVLSPLPMGSGLKIKVIEAMSQGKAIVASPASLQGLPASIHEAVIEAETAEAFADAVVHLLNDRAERAARGEKARRLAEALFSREVAHAPLVEWLKRAGGNEPFPSHRPSIMAPRLHK